MTRRQGLNLSILVVLNVLAHTAFSGGRVALALFAIQLGGTGFEVGLVLSMLAVMPMLFSVYAGRWTDRSGAFTPMLVALLMLVFAALLALLPSLVSLGAAAVLLGSGYMLVHLAVNNAVGQGSTAANRTYAFSTLAVGNSASTVAGPVIAGVLIDFAGHARTSLVLALLPLLALVLLVVGRQRMTTPSAVPPASANPKLADLLAHAPLRAVLIVSTLLSMGQDLFTFMMPIHGERIGLSASTIGMVMGAFGVGTFVVRMVVAPLSRRLSEWQMLAGVLALTAAVYMVFPLFRAVPTLLALAFVLGLALGAALPMVMSGIQQVAPPGRSGEAIGVRSMLINTSQSVLPVTFGTIGSAAGTGFVFWAVAALLCGGLVYARRRRSKS